MPPWVRTGRGTSGSAALTLVVAGAATALLAAAGSVAAFQWRRADRLAGQDAQRQLVAATAADLGRALFTYDYRQLAATEARVQALATGAFAAAQRRSAPALEASLEKARAQGAAQVVEVDVTGVAPEGAAALVVVDTVASGSAGSVRGVQYLHLQLVRTTAGWRVERVQRLTAPAAG